ncbi:pathogenesis-related protein PR-1 type-like [Rutidosis leptorrhynchoides]|uniref:pathogenesis-related protein PR-1 type-like n=1 Tax=Rutidosis leptorrhynchoides TaxID=125765 RepID=UPI003A9A10B1
MHHQLIYLSLIYVIFLSILQVSHSHSGPEDYVNAHNAARKEVGVKPLKWDPTVAKFAVSYANKRKADGALVHSHYDKYGENIALGWGEFTGLDAMKLWVDEKRDYDYKSNSCKPGKMCAHYTQVVWKNTTRIGCGRVMCVNGAWFVTCNYDPPGNYIGQKPY